MVIDRQLDGKFVVPDASSGYRTIKKAYGHSSYTIEFSTRLIRTGKRYYNSLLQIPEGQRMSTAGEELALQRSYELSGEDPTRAEIFNDFFDRNGRGWFAWQWTNTGLRVPKNRDAGKYETDAHGRKYWTRIVLAGDKEIDEILVPEGNGRVVVEWDNVFGLPKTTEKLDFPHNPYNTNFWFEPNPGKDNRSGHYDVAVGRRSGWIHNKDEWCLGVDASCERWDADMDVGFRPVRGPLPEIKKITIENDLNNAEKSLLKSMRDNYGERSR